jgi:hypothetical protein
VDGDSLAGTTWVSARSHTSGLSWASVFGSGMLRRKVRAPLLVTGLPLATITALWAADLPVSVVSLSSPVAPFSDAVLVRIPGERVVGVMNLSYPLIGPAAYQ